MPYSSDAEALDALLQAALQADEELDLLHSLLDAYPHLANARSPQGMRPLTAAIYGYSYEGIKRLRACGAQPTLFEAAALGDLAALAALLKADPAEVHAYSFDGWTALHLAAEHGRIDAVRMLLAAAADPNAGSRSDPGNTPLSLACSMRGNAPIALLFLEAGAEVNVHMQYGGQTPLHRAVDTLDEPMIQVLLAHGADRMAKDDRGETPYRLLLSSRNSGQ
jgi:ankyrin repeat protein